MFPFTESRCDLCDIGMWLCLLVFVGVGAYLNWKYEIKERKR